VWGFYRKDKIGLLFQTLLNPNNVRIGHVDMEFTVDVEGMVRGPVVIEEVPEACGFANSAMKALPKWRFKPEVKDGKPIPSKARYRINFKMSGSSATPAEASPQTGKPAANPR
jgi:hypothetical protein